LVLTENKSREVRQICSENTTSAPVLLQIMDLLLTDTPEKSPAPLRIPPGTDFVVTPTAIRFQTLNGRNLMLSIHRIVSVVISFFKNIYGSLDSTQVFAYQNTRLRVLATERRLEEAARRKVGIF
jgi:hypothetical protein